MSEPVIRGDDPIQARQARRQAIVTTLIVLPILWWHQRQAKLIKDIKIS